MVQKLHKMKSSSKLAVLNTLGGNNASINQTTNEGKYTVNTTNTKNTEGDLNNKGRLNS